MRTERAAARHGRANPTGRGRRCAAFTLIELLVVIAIIMLLVAVISVAGVAVIRYQKVQMTKNIIRTTMMAIEQFAEADPLKDIYDAKGKETFGPYPPYPLYRSSSGALKVPDVVESDLTMGSLSVRFQRDFPGNRAAGQLAGVRIEPGGANGDNRALYTYLKVYTPDALQSIPERAVHAFAGSLIGPEAVNPLGSDTSDGATGLVDVLGIHDAWDVPLDYFLYVKLEYGPDPLRPTQGKWRVAERKPALRSRGVSLAEAAGDVDPDKWIFSDPFPSPAAYSNGATFRKDGLLPSGSDSGRAPGWARAVGEGDLNALLDAADPALFGYVP